MDEHEDWLEKHVHAPKSKPNENLAVALEMAAAGLPIFPAKVFYNETKKTWEKQPHIKGWQAEASCDEKTLRAWWREWKDAVPGIELGRAGLIMLDPDRHNGGPNGVEKFPSPGRAARPLARTPDHLHRRGGRASLLQTTRRRALHQCRGRAQGQKHQRPRQGRLGGRTRSAAPRWQALGTAKALAQALRDDTIPFLTGWPSAT